MEYQRSNNVPQQIEPGAQPEQPRQMPCSSPVDKAVSFIFGVGMPVQEIGDVQVGDRVKITYGPQKGKLGTIERIDHEYSRPYFVRLDDGNTYSKDGTLPFNHDNQVNHFEKVVEDVL
jgi:hypothetical protein